MMVWLNDSFNAACEINATEMFKIIVSNVTVVDANLSNAMGDNITSWEECGVFKEEYYVFVFIGLSIFTSSMYLIQVGERSLRMRVGECVQYTCM